MMLICRFSDAEHERIENNKHKINFTSHDLTGNKAPCTIHETSWLKFQEMKCMTKLPVTWYTTRDCAEFHGASNVDKRFIFTEQQWIVWWPLTYTHRFNSVTSAQPVIHDWGAYGRVTIIPRQVETVHMNSLKNFKNVCLLTEAGARFSIRLIRYHFSNLQKTFERHITGRCRSQSTAFSCGLTPLNTTIAGTFAQGSLTICGVVLSAYSA